MTHPAATPQPDPISDLQQSVYVDVMESILARVRLGQERYNTQLSTFNGRDARLDLEQELIDALMYLKQWNRETRQIDSLLMPIIYCLDHLKRIMRQEGVVLPENCETHLDEANKAVKLLVQYNQRGQL